MKLATYKDGSRDGQLVVVSRDLTQAHFAAGIAGRLQQVLDDWNFLSPQLEDLYATLNGGKARHAVAFDPRLTMAPLPRAGRWAWAADDGGAGLVHLAADDLQGPCDVLRLAHPDDAEGLAFEPGLVAVTGDVERGVDVDRALDGVRLLGLACVWRPLAPHGGHAGPTCAPATFAPVLATPDEFGAAWGAGRPRLGIASQTRVRGAGTVDALPTADGVGPVIARLARHGRVRAGSLIGIAAPSAGASTGAHDGAHDGAPTGATLARRLRPGDRLHVTLDGVPGGPVVDGAGLCGAIDVRITGPDEPHGPAPQT